MHLNPLQRFRRRMAEGLGGPRAAIGLEKGALSVTFDDFPRTAWTEGGAVLAAHGVKGTYYVSGRLCGGTMDGQEQYSEDDLTTLSGAGHEVGCHTFDHISALKSSPAAFARSIEENAKFIADRLDGLEARSFAYPYGHACLTAFRTISDHNFTSARLVVGGCNGPSLRPLRLSALALENGRPEAGGWEALVEKAAAERRWLIIMTHDVQDRPSPYGCTPAVLDALLTSSRRAGLDIRPVASVIQARSSRSG
jgi:peptidoglycan/xylan/chitin deacetylase (PgdA/CDA1 family)